MFRLVSPKRFLFERRIDKGLIELSGLPVEELERLSFSPRARIRARVSSFSTVSKETLSRLARDKNEMVCSTAFSNRETPPDALATGVERFIGSLREGGYSPLNWLADNPATPPASLAKIFVAVTAYPNYLASFSVSPVVDHLCSNPSTPANVLIYFDELYALRGDGRRQRQSIYLNKNFPGSLIWEKAVLGGNEDPMLHSAYEALAARLGASARASRERGKGVIIRTALDAEIRNAQPSRGGFDDWDAVSSRITSTAGSLTDAQVIAALAIMDSDPAGRLPIGEVITSAKEIAPSPAPSAAAPAVSSSLPKEIGFS